MSHNHNSEDTVNEFSAQVKAVGGYFLSATNRIDVAEYIGQTTFNEEGLSQVLTESSVCKMQIDHGTSLQPTTPPSFYGNNFDPLATERCKGLSFDNASAKA